jgi:hypothetical protein
VTAEPYYQHDLSLVHERGFGFHGERCAPGVLALLKPVRGGLVDTSGIPELLRSRGVSASVRSSFGDEELPPGLKTVIGARN